MPTYDYRCESCKHEFEQFQSITAASLKKCPKCKKQKLRRLIGTGAALLFKGDGFYITDYRSEKYKAAAKADAPSTGETKKAGEGGSSTESPAKGDSKPKESRDKESRHKESTQKESSQPAAPPPTAPPSEKPEGKPPKSRGKSE